MTPMLVYALVSSQAPSETIELYLRRDDAEAGLGAALADEPWLDRRAERRTTRA